LGIFYKIFIQKQKKYMHKIMIKLGQSNYQKKISLSWK